MAKKRTKSCVLCTYNTSKWDALPKRARSVVDYCDFICQLLYGCINYNQSVDQRKWKALCRFKKEVGMTNQYDISNNECSFSRYCTAIAFRLEPFFLGNTREGHSSNGLDRGQ